MLRTAVVALLGVISFLLAPAIKLLVAPVVLILPAKKGPEEKAKRDIQGWHRRIRNIWEYMGLGSPASQRWKSAPILTTRALTTEGCRRYMSTMIEIREEGPLDIGPVREVNMKAFGQVQEADIVDRLRAHCDDLLSLVAVVHTDIVGHILFSPATIEGKHGLVEGMGLAPMAVLPQHQRQGIGSELIRAGLSELKRRQCHFVIVLGHPEYYPRFGFEPASRRGIRCEWKAPDEAFMILELNASACRGISGVAKYRPEFAEGA